MTLFGSVNMIDIGDGSNIMKPCYYFVNSSFYRYKDRIDGAVISSLNKYALCINNYSPNYNSFKRSSFCEAFKDGVIDPIEREKKDSAYIADTEIDRRNKGEVLKYVQEKYKKSKLIDLNFTGYSASVLVPAK